MTPEVKSPEDAVRYYDAADMYGFACDCDPQPDEGWLSFSTILCILFFAAVCFGAGMVITAVWSASDDVPARGVQDSIR